MLSTSIHADAFNTNDSRMRILLHDDDNKCVNIDIIHDSIPMRNPNVSRLRSIVAVLSLVDDDDNDGMAI